MIFYVLLAAVAVAAGGVASVVGFGIGSLLTPIFAREVGTRLAVAAVAIPHVCGTALRLWGVRKSIDRVVLLNFGITSAAGGLAGALMHTWLQSAALGYVLGALLVFAAIMELAGAASRMRFSGAAAWVAGALSGFFGGLVGNQGGIRSAALLGFDIRKESFVATATAIALMVDAARVPVYVATQAREIAEVWHATVLMTVGVIAGTVLGWYLLSRIPSQIFRRIVAVAILILGISMFLAPGR